MLGHLTYDIGRSTARGLASPVTRSSGGGSLAGYGVVVIAAIVIPIVVWIAAHFLLIVLAVFGLIVLAVAAVAVYELWPVEWDFWSSWSYERYKSRRREAARAKLNAKNAKNWTGG